MMRQFSKGLNVGFRGVGCFEGANVLSGSTAEARIEGSLEDGLVVGTLEVGKSLGDALGLVVDGIIVGKDEVGLVLGANEASGLMVGSENDGHMVGFASVGLNVGMTTGINEIGFALGESVGVVKEGLKVGTFVGNFVLLHVSATERYRLKLMPSAGIKSQSAFRGGSALSEVSHSRMRSPFTLIKVQGMPGPPKSRLLPSVCTYVTLKLPPVEISDRV